MSTPILHLVTFLVVTPHSDPHVILDVQIASPSLPRHHNAQTEPRRPIHHNCTSMIMSHLLHTGQHASFVTTAVHLSRRSLYKLALIFVPILI